jgi:hypothetical protein
MCREINKQIISYPILVYFSMCASYVFENIFNIRGRREWRGGVSVERVEGVCGGEGRGVEG